MTIHMIEIESFKYRLDQDLSCQKGTQTSITITYCELFNVMKT